MSFTIDARVPVRFGVADPDAAALIEVGLPDQPACTFMRFVAAAAPASHPTGCACCIPCGPMTEALRRLFLARAKGEVPFFCDVRVFASPAAEAALRAALRDDGILAAWFRAEASKSIQAASQCGKH